MLPYAPGSRAVIRDEEWLIRRIDPCTDGGWLLTCDGASELVRGQSALFLTTLERRIEVLEPARIQGNNPGLPQDSWASLMPTWTRVCALRSNYTRRMVLVKIGSPVAQAWAWRLMSCYCCISCNPPSCRAVSAPLGVAPPTASTGGFPGRAGILCDPGVKLRAAFFLLFPSFAPSFLSFLLPQQKPPRQCSMDTKRLLARLCKYHWSPVPPDQYVFPNRKGEMVGFGTLAHKNYGVANLVWLANHPIDTSGQHLKCIQDWVALERHSETVIGDGTIEDRLTLLTPKQFRKWMLKHKSKIPAPFLDYALKAFERSGV